MSTLADAKVTHNYNCNNGDFIGCLLFTCLEIPIEIYVFIGITVSV